MSNKELCLAWLEWFKVWVETHDKVYSSGVLATTTKTFDYNIWECDNIIRLTSGIRFKIVDSDKEVYVPYINKTYIITDKGDDYFYKDVLGSFTRTIVYGKDFMSLSNIMRGNSDLNWKYAHGDPNQYKRKTLKDVINEVHPNTFRK